MVNITYMSSGMSRLFRRDMNNNAIVYFWAWSWNQSRKAMAGALASPDNSPPTLKKEPADNLLQSLPFQTRFQ